MNRKKLDKLWKALEVARRSPQKESDLVDLATMAGRRMESGGNHPMWYSTYFPHRRGFPISRHGGNPEVAPYVRNIIIGHLEGDAALLEEYLDPLDGGQEKKNGNGGV